MTANDPILTLPQWRILREVADDGEAGVYDGRAQAGRGARAARPGRGRRPMGLAAGDAALHPPPHGGRPRVRARVPDVGVNPPRPTLPFPVYVTEHARERARERFPGFKAARIIDEVRAAFREGRFSGRPAAGVRERQA